MSLRVRCLAGCLAMTICLATSALAATDPPPITASPAPVTSAEVETSAATASDTDPGVVPGRPGFTESRSLVPIGRVQFEAGYGFSREDDFGAITNQHTYPGAVLRVGMTPRLEFRLAGFGIFAQRDRTRDGLTASTAATDVQAGFKLLLAREDRFPVELSIIPMVSVPVGGMPFSSENLDPNITVAFGRALPLAFDATGILRAASLTVGGQRYTQYSGSVLVSRDIRPGWNAYGEVFSTTALEPGPAAWNMDVGIARRVTRLLQVDIEVGRGLNGAAPDWQFGAGLVLRGR